MASACFAADTACSVQLLPQPKMILIRPFAFFTEYSITETFSSSVIVAGSPVVPRMTSISVPAVIWRSIISPKELKFTPPFAPKGVIIAVAVPLKNPVIIYYILPKPHFSYFFAGLFFL